jgi:hypothetical protein
MFHRLSQYDAAMVLIEEVKAMLAKMTAMEVAKRTAPHVALSSSPSLDVVRSPSPSFPPPC